MNSLRISNDTFVQMLIILSLLINSVSLQKPNSGENPTFFNIGGVLSSSESEKNFSETIAVSRCNISATIKILKTESFSDLKMHRLIMKKISSSFLKRFQVM
jgi:hypothetical protein